VILSPAAVVRLAAALPGLVAEVRGALAQAAPIVVVGPPASSVELARGLARDGDRSLVRELPVALLRDGALAGAAAVVYIVKVELTPTDDRALGAAARARVPVVCLVLGPEGYLDVLSLVPASTVVRARTIDDATVAAVAERLAARGVDALWPVARALPVLRAPVLRALDRPYAGRGLAFGALGRPLADPSGVVLNQVRMVLRQAAVGGVDPGRAFPLAIAGAAGAGLGLGALTRRIAGRRIRPLEVAVAYGGTWALARVVATVLERRSAA
jgi:hypothetical protein